MKQINHFVGRFARHLAATSLVVVSAVSVLTPALVANAASPAAAPVATHAAKRKVYIAHVNIQAWAAKDMHRKILPHGEWYVDMGKRKTWHGWHLALINTDYGLCWIGVPYIGL